MQYDYGKNKVEHPDPVKAEVKGKEESKLHCWNYISLEDWIARIAV